MREGRGWGTGVDLFLTFWIAKIADMLSPRLLDCAPREGNYLQRGRRLGVSSLFILCEVVLRETFLGGF
jgi:hypothetical protein